MPIASSSTGPHIFEDQTPHILPFLLPLIQYHLTTTSSPLRPFIIGLNGPQGIGKTTLVSNLAQYFRHFHNLETLVLSIDDFYLPYEQQIALAEEQKANPLVQHRGEPGTHDVPLLEAVFRALVHGEEVKIPAYDKSAFAGRGDRVNISEWQVVNSPTRPRLQVVILEGWFVGFRPLSDDHLRQIVETSRLAGVGTLCKHHLENLDFVNQKLKRYKEVWSLFDAFIHLDAEDLKLIYEWREEAEDAVRRKRGDGFGMTKGQVETFVDGYMPAYELYTNGLRRGFFYEKDNDGENSDVDLQGRQMRLLLGIDRKVKEVATI